MSRTTFIRLRELANRKETIEGKTITHSGIVPVSAPTIWRWISEGTFPAPKRLGANSVAWDSAEVDAWIANCQTK
jgi:predicted DNA-binding transcriptional regulator AlpA